MNILLTHGYFIKSDLHESQIMKPYPPLGLLFLSSWLKREGLQNEVFDTTFSTPEELKSNLEILKPGIIGIYSTLMTKMNVLKIIAFIKSSKSLFQSRIILGGPDARYNAAEYLRHGADVVIPGEGEIALSETIRVFNGNSGKELADVRGIIFNDKNGMLISTGNPGLVDLMDLPFPARESIDQSIYLNKWKEVHGYSSMNINTMRGCPYSCNWCSKSVFGNTFRRRDPSAVVEEMIRLKDVYHPDQVWFTDDVFTISPEWIRKFTSELFNRKIKMPYECITRSDCLDEGILDLLGNSGCTKIWIGAESGSQKVIEMMNRKINIRQTIEIINKAKKKGISTGTFIMLGYPGEDKSDILKTANYLNMASPDELTIGLAYPIKGTKFFELSEQDFLKPYSWEESNEREIVFRRQYSGRFYRFAIRYLFNVFKAGQKSGGMKKSIFKLKSFIAKMYILWFN